MLVQNAALNMILRARLPGAAWHAACKSLRQSTTTT